MTVDDLKRMEKYHGEMLLHHKKLKDHFTSERKKLEQRQRAAKAERTSGEITNKILERLKR